MAEQSYPDSGVCFGQKDEPSFIILFLFLLLDTLSPFFETQEEIYFCFSGYILDWLCIRDLNIEFYQGNKVAYHFTTIRSDSKHQILNNSSPRMDECSVIVGMACRVPGASNPSQLWENIVAKRDLRGAMPRERFNINGFYHPSNVNKGTINTKYGYFLDQPLGHFDAEFFGVSGKEAEAMDPQQRMLLEVVYEALEDAGISLDKIRGTCTSVYCGSYTTANDYHALQGKDLEFYPKYAITGTGNALLSNRISYFYNLHGPSMTVDTACSSSLVSFHLANQSLLNGEADYALVVGSALHFAPNAYQTMSDMGFISSDGRCHSFDSSGTGYARGDGICAVVLKRRSDALQHQDRIRAVVRASGVNHDGKTDGITLPSAEAQEALIRSTYSKAGLNPDDTQFFEAHGTGTKAGDPLEAEAIGLVFGTSTRTEPLYVGSVKSNIGHLEGAAGLAGIIKAALAIERKKIPPNMLFVNPNPEIHFKEWKLEVPTAEFDWTTSSTNPRRASINSFGYGGANAHVILESCTTVPVPTTQLNGFHIAESEVNCRPYLLPLTSHSEEAGKLMKSKLIEYVLAREELAVQDLAYSLTVKRSMHRLRSFAVGDTRQAIIKEIDAPRAAASWTNATKTSHRAGFVFTGQGAQSFDMGRQLVHQSPIFKSTLEKCNLVLQSLPDGPSWSIVGEMLRSEEDSQLSQSKISQPICTALQLALVILLRDWGVNPTAVCGHSSGEIAAAYAAGILSLEAAMVVAYYRGLHMTHGNDYPVPGSMMAIGMSSSEAEAELQAYKGRLNIAAVNSPTSVTVSGDNDAIVEFQKVLISRNTFARMLKVEQAFHSHHMRPLAPGYERSLANCPLFSTTAASCRMVSSVTGRVVDGSELNATYWAGNMVLPVLFADALIGVLLDEDEAPNVDVMVEIGPHPALKSYAREVASSLKMTIPYFGSLARGVTAFDSLLETAGQLFTIGYPIDLEAVNRDYIIFNGKLSQELYRKYLEDLPSYSWNHKNYWFSTRLVKEYLQRPQKHTILGAPIPGSIDSMPRWRNYLRLSEVPWLRDHMVDGKVIFPAAGYCCMAIEGAIRLKDERPTISVIRLKEVFIKAPLSLKEDTDQGSETLVELHPVSVSARTVSDEWYEFSVSSYDEAGQHTEHCRGCVSIEYGMPQYLKPKKQYPSFQELRRRSDRYLPASVLYSRLEGIGLHYGERFALLDKDISSGPGFSAASLTYNPNVFTPHELAEQTFLHPTLLDASFHVIFSAIETLLERQITDAFVSTFMGSLEVSGSLAQSGYSYEQKYSVRTFTRLPSQRTALNEILLNEEDGDGLVLEAQGIEVTALGTDSGRSKGRTLFFRQQWRPCFDLLSPESRSFTELNNLEALLDLYVFQHPSSRILYIPPTYDEARRIIRCLIENGSGRSRFQVMHVLPSTSHSTCEFVRLAKDYNSLVRVCEPEEGYDLIIWDKQATKPLSFDVFSFLNRSGTLLSNEDFSVPGSFKPMNRLGPWGTFRNINVVRERNDLTVILSSSKVSKFTENIFEQIKRSERFGQLLQTDFETLSQRDIATSNVLVLASLDEGIETPETWIGIRHLLTQTQKSVVWLVQGAAMECSNPEHAKVVGLLRTARNENHESRFISLDVEKSCSADLISKSISQILGPELEEEDFAIRNCCIYIPRIEEDTYLNRKLPNGAQNEPRLDRFANHPALKLNIGKVGLLETLHFSEDEEVTKLPFGDDEVEIKVMASALNFHDIATSMGIIQDYNLGDECAGYVARTGSRVDIDAFKPGDRVIAWRPGQGAHRTLVRQQAMMCLKIPDSMSFSVAASLPIILTTAHYALIDVGRLQPGETVLIHAAAGGVGQVAIQIAQNLGAHILATCSEPKREFLRTRFGLADEQIFSSRDDSFVRAVHMATNGNGVDVALNSLAGKLLHATWNCMNSFGRFVEIGKRDIHQNSNLAMDPFRKNVTFASVDMITIYEKNKQLARKLLDASFSLFFDGDMKPPENIYEFPYSQVEKAFRMLQLGKKPGKVVLVPHDDDMVLVAPPTYRDIPLFNATKTYLLVGGLGGLGTAVAEWMYRRGARTFAFMSRSGIQKPHSRKTVDWLRSKNARVSVHRGDVAELSDVKNVIANIGSSLAGVFHIAVVLQDAMIQSLTFSQLQIGLRTKCTGAWNLHQATQSLHLDFFVCWSSVSAICGNKGQAAYVAANAYLDALMRWRREQGLVGTAMNLGAVPTRGLVAENAQIRQSLERNKLDILTEQELMYLVEEAVLLDRPKSDMRGIDWHQIIVGVNLKQPDVWWSERSVFRNLYANREYGHSSSAGKVAKNLAVDLAAATNVGSRISVLLEAFIQKVASVLGTPLESISAENPLSFYGLDSIVSVEFRKWFKDSADVDLSLFDVLSAKSISSLVAKVAGMMPLKSMANATTDESSDHFFGTQGLRDLRSHTVSAISHIPKANVSGPVPMSPFQSRMYYLHVLAKEKWRLNLSGVFHLKGKPSIEALRESYRETILRQPVLNTAFSDNGYLLQQRVLSDVVSPMKFHDLSQACSPEEELEKLISHDKHHNLEIEKGEVATSAVVKMSDGDFIMIFVAHHICFDRGSLFIFMDTWMDLYSSITTGRSTETTAFPRITYTDFTLWYNKRLEHDSRMAHVDFWKENLNGIPTTSKLLPFAQKARDSNLMHERALQQLQLNSNLVKRMKRICAHLNATPFHFLLAAFRAFLFRYTEEQDLVLLMIDGNRLHVDAEELVGTFVNVVPLRFNEDCSKLNLEDLVTSSSRITLRALCHNEVGFEEIVGLLDFPRTPLNMPVGQIAVNYQMHGAVPDYRTDDFEITTKTLENIPTPYELALEAVEGRDGELEIILEHAIELYDNQDMEKFLGDFLIFLTSSIRDHRQPITGIDIFEPDNKANTQQRSEPLDSNGEFTPNGVSDVSSKVVPKTAKMIAKRKMVHLTPETESSNGSTMSLQELLSTSSVEHTTSGGSSSSIEDQIIRLAQEILQSDRPMTAKSNFFDCGGDSLLLILFHTRLAKTFGEEAAPSLATMLESPTPESLARVIFGYTQKEPRNEAAARTEGPSELS